MGIPHLYSWGAIFCVLSLAISSTLGQFSHKKPWPTYSLQNMPQTRFTCHDKILGGYYADPETQCQMFHVCVKVAGVGVQDFRFLCPNSTAFDQEAQICADWGDVDCEQAVLYYGSDNFDLYRLGSGFESKRAPLAEEEEATFHLQRAETGDIRRSKETRVDQKLRPETQPYPRKHESTTRNTFYDSAVRRTNYDQNNDFNKFEAPKKTTSSYYTTPKGNDVNSDSKQEADDLFKGSHSSNFFSNRNGGREDDFYDSKSSTTATSTTTTPRPYNPPNQFLNGNRPQNDFNDFNKIPDTSTKRPHRSRRPIQNNSHSLTSNPTSRPSTTTTTYATTVPDFPKTTKRLTLQTSFNAGFNFGNDQFNRPTSQSSSSSTSTTTTQRTSSTAQKFSFATNDYQQNIQPTTYSPSSAFRYKTTTSKYDEVDDSALRGEKPGQGTLYNSQDDNQNIEIFSRVSSRKSQNSERIIQKQQAKDTSLANRNEFTDFTKNKTPSGFQIPSRAQQIQHNTQQAPVSLDLNEQPLDPSKLNSELRNINQTQQLQRGRISNSRFNDRQQTEPQYFRVRPQETPAPFAVPQDQQQQAQKKFDVSPFVEFSRIKPESKLEKPQSTNTFDINASKPRTEQRTVSNLDSQSHQITKDSNFNSYKETSRTRPKQRTGDVKNGDYQPQSQQSQNSNINGFNSSQRDINRSRPEQQRQSSNFNEYNSRNTQRDFNRIKSEQSSTTSGSITESPSPRGRGRINYKATTQQGKFIDNSIQSTTSTVKKFSTLVPKDQYYPTTFKPTSYKKAYDQKPIKHLDPKSYPTTPLASTTAQPLNTPDEDDGQYHPELYEIDYTRNNAAPTRRPVPQTTSYSESSLIATPQHRQQPTATQTTRSPQAHLQSQQQTAFQKQQSNFQQQHKSPTATAIDLSDEEELFKTAHSLNLGAASINKLRSDTLKSADKDTQHSSQNFGFERSTHQTTISPAPLTGTTTTTWRPTTSLIAPTTTIRPPTPSAKPKKSSASKRPPHADADTSYDYAYYDSLSETPQEYTEYDVISEFRKTKKH